jgi:hypothetical protein
LLQRWSQLSLGWPEKCCERILRRLIKQKSEPTRAADENDNTARIDKGGAMSINSNSVCLTLSPLTLDTSMTDSSRTKARSGDTTAAATGHLSNDENGSPTGFLAGGCGRPKGSTINSKRGANHR